MGTSLPNVTPCATWMAPKSGFVKGVIAKGRERGKKAWLFAGDRICAIKCGAIPGADLGHAFRVGKTSLCALEDIPTTISLPIPRTYLAVGTIIGSKTILAFVDLASAIFATFARSAFPIAVTAGTHRIRVAALVKEVDAGSTHAILTKHGLAIHIQLVGRITKGHFDEHLRDKAAHRSKGLFNQRVEFDRFAVIVFSTRNAYATSVILSHDRNAGRGTYVHPVRQHGVFDLVQSRQIPKDLAHVQIETDPGAIAIFRAEVGHLRPRFGQYGEVARDIRTSTGGHATTTVTPIDRFVAGDEVAFTTFAIIIGLTGSFGFVQSPAYFDAHALRPTHGATSRGTRMGGRAFTAMPRCFIASMPRVHHRSTRCAILVHRAGIRAFIHALALFAGGLGITGK